MRLVLAALTAFLAAGVQGSQAISSTEPSSQLCSSDPAMTTASENYQCAEVLVTEFLQRAMRLRSVMLERGMQSQADRLWGAATQYAAIVLEDDPDQAGGFVPILLALSSGFDSAIDQNGQPKVDEIELVQAALEDQLQIYSNPGAFAGANGLVSLKVQAVLNGQPQSGYFVSADLWPFIPQDVTAGQFPHLTPNATKPIKGAKYFIRVYRPGSPNLKGCTIYVVGEQSLDDSIEVPVDGRACAR